MVLSQEAASLKFSQKQTLEEEERPKANPDFDSHLSNQIDKILSTTPEAPKADEIQG